MDYDWKKPVAVVGLALVPVIAWSALAPAPFATGPTPINALPFVISAPGSYCLTGNLTAQPGEDGIDVLVDDVVIDLGGFRLSGGGGSGQFGVQSARQNITVRNGSVKGWGQYAIDLGDLCTVSDVYVFSFEASAIRMGNRARVERTRTETFQADMAQGTAGISVQSASVVEDCHVFVSAAGSTPGRGIFASQRSTVVDCKVIGGSIGIAAERFSWLARCDVSNTLSTGIQVLDSARVRECNVSAANQSGQAGAAGIVGFQNARIEDCIVEEAQGAGIRFTQAYGRVERCDVRLSTGDGVVVQGDTHLLGNRAFANDGVGIRVLGDRCVLKENVVDGNLDRGIVVEGTLNLVERNRSYQNKGDDYVVPFGNPYGEIERPFAQMNGLDPQANYETPPGF